MTNQETLVIILKTIARCTTFEQLQVLSKAHAGHMGIQQAINERACQLLD